MDIFRHGQEVIRLNTEVVRLRVLEMHSHTESRNECIKCNLSTKPGLESIQKVFTLFYLVFVCFAFFLSFVFSRFYLNAYKYPDIPSLSLPLPLSICTYYTANNN